MEKKKSSSQESKEGGKVLKWIGIISAIIGLILGISQVSKLYSGWNEKEKKVSGLINDSHLRSATADYSGAWKNLEDALIVDPSSEKVESEQTSVAMQWIRNIRLSGARGETKFSDVVDKLLPVLYHKAGMTKGTEKADVLSHIGYANYLKRRDGQVDMKVEENFTAALAEDSENVYAHAMLGFWLMFPSNANGDFNEGEKHFAMALKSGREQKYVRQLHLSALDNCNFNYEHEARIFEVINEMRKLGDTIDPEGKQRILSDAYSYEKGVLDSISTILSPQDHLSTFLYLAEGTNIEEHPLFRFAYARIIEKTGDTAKALSMYQAIYSDKELKFFNRREDVKRAIYRLNSNRNK
ncbi:MAG: hypothetical protein ABI855_04555 [Bacteroidota bacterium]